MEQIKCASCEFTKFFVNSIAETSMISCCECGASFIIGTPTTQPVKEPEPVEKPVEFPEEPKQVTVQELEKSEEIVESKIVDTNIDNIEKIKQQKPLIRKLSPEEKQELLLKMDEGVE